MIDRIFALIGAFAFAQFPQFFAQYLHELSGHLAELVYQVNLLEQSAKLSNKSVIELIAKFKSNPDPDIIRQGDLMQGIIDRMDSFTIALHALTHSNLFTKPFLFVRYLNGGILTDTAKNYQIGFSLTLEGVVYAFIGMVVGYYLFEGLRALLNLKADPIPKKT